MEPISLVLWDWNGTLLDDVDVCVDCLNRLLAEHGYPQHYTLPQYRAIFGFPIEDYYVRAGFDFSRHSFAELARRYMELYIPGAEVCCAADGAREVLEQFRRSGRRQVILSASPVGTLQRQVSHLSLDGYFDELLGLGDIYGKSKVDMARGWMARSGLAPAAGVMIGDSLHDAEVAAAIGVRCILCAAGHQTRAALESAGCPVVDSLREIPALVEKGW